MNTRTALLVIDVQVGAFNGERCPPISNAKHLLLNVHRLIEGARAAKHTVIFVQHSAGPGEVLERGTNGWKLHPIIEPLQDEWVVTKEESSAFAETDLHETLQAHSINALVVCGLQSEACVRHTVLSAVELGYTVTVAQDAHSTWPDAGCTAHQIVERQNAFFAEAGALLMPTDAITTRSQAMK